MTAADKSCNTTTAGNGAKGEQVEEAGQITRRRIQVKQIEQNFCFHLGRFQGGLSLQWGRPTEADAKSHSTTVPGKRFAWCLLIFFSVFFVFVCFGFAVLCCPTTTIDEAFTRRKRSCCCCCCCTCCCYLFFLLLLLLLRWRLAHNLHAKSGEAR